MILRATRGPSAKMESGDSASASWSTERASSGAVDCRFWRPMWTAKTRKDMAELRHACCSAMIRLLTLPVALATVGICCAAPLPAQHAATTLRIPFPAAAATLVGDSLALGLVVALAATRDGGVLVVDRSTAQVLRVTRRGDVAVRYGRMGDGPGELRAPYRVAERSDGSVIVFDQSNERFSEFTADGRFVQRWATSARIVNIGSIVALPDRAIAITGVVRAPRAIDLAIHVFDSTFQLRRSFAPLPRARSRELLEQFVPGSLRPTRNGNLLYLRIVPYELRWYSPEGEHRRTLVIPKRVIESVDEFFSVRRSGTRVTTRVERGRPYPLWAVELQDGRLLAARTDAGDVYWDALDATGRLLRSVRAPERLGGPSQWIQSLQDAAWFTGTTGDGEPVLYYVEFAEHITRQ